MGVKTLYTFNKAATVEATAYLGTAQVGGPVTIKNGVGGCSSTFGATCAVTISAPAGEHFDTVRLKAVSGAFGLQTAQVRLESEVDKVVACVPGTSVTEGTTTVTYQGGGTCTEVGIVVENSDQEVKFLKPSNDPNAKFVLKIDWTVPTTPQVPGTTVNFKNTDLAADDKPITWCVNPTYDGQGNLTGADIGDDLEPSAQLPYVQYACVGKQTTTIKDAKLAVEEQIFLVGDVALRK